MDSDMLCLDDIVNLWKLRDYDKIVQVVKHPERDWTINKYNQQVSNKFRGAVQYNYPKKNWSSLMLMNTGFCEALDPFLVEKALPSYLHRFEWVRDSNKVGEIPKEWNYLVDYDNTLDKAPSLVHYTRGGPWYPEYRNCEYAAQWFQEYSDMIGAEQFRLHQQNGHIRGDQESDT